MTVGQLVNAISHKYKTKFQAVVGNNYNPSINHNSPMIGIFKKRDNVDMFSRYTEEDNSYVQGFFSNNVQIAPTDYVILEQFDVKGKIGYDVDILQIELDNETAKSLKKYLK